MKKLLVSIAERVAPAYAKYRRFRIIDRTPLRALQQKRYFEPELKLLPEILKGVTGACIDVGAHVGEYCFVLERCVASSSIYAFEPHPESCATLRRLFPSVHVAKLALSDNVGTTELHVPVAGEKVYATRSTLEDVPESSSETHTIETTTLDTFSEKLDAPVAFVKIDVEGHELSVLAGARKTIERDHPILLIEIEQKRLEKPLHVILVEIEALGYQGFFLDMQQMKCRTVSEFDPELMQRESDFKSPKYINNFFFFPVDRSDELVGRMSVSLQA